MIDYKASFVPFLGTSFNGMLSYDTKVIIIVFVPFLGDFLSIHRIL